MKKDAYQRELERQKEAVYEAARKYNRAQERLNRAAVAWAKVTDYLPTGWIHGAAEVKLLRAVRAFEKAGK